MFMLLFTIITVVVTFCLVEFFVRATVVPKVQGSQDMKNKHPHSWGFEDLDEKVNNIEYSEFPQNIFHDEHWDRSSHLD